MTELKSAEIKPVSTDLYGLIYDTQLAVQAAATMLLKKTSSMLAILTASSPPAPTDSAEPAPKLSTKEVFVPAPHNKLASVKHHGINYILTAAFRQTDDYGESPLRRWLGRSRNERWIGILVVDHADRKSKTVSLAISDRGSVSGSESRIEAWGSLLDTRQKGATLADEQVALTGRQFWDTTITVQKVVNGIGRLHQVSTDLSAVHTLQDAWAKVVTNHSDIPLPADHLPQHTDVSGDIAAAEAEVRADEH